MIYQTLAPLSNAEKCRRYQIKKAETYRKADVLTKREYRKAKNPLTNENRLKIQREKKRVYREKSRKQNKENPTSPPSFTGASTRKRSIKKVVKALPMEFKIPSNRIEIVKSLASKLDLRIKLDQKKLGSPEMHYISDEKETWLSKFLDRRNITYTNPAKIIDCTLGKK